MVLGISQIVKCIAIALFPLCLAALLIYDWQDIKNLLLRQKIKQLNLYS